MVISYKKVDALDYFGKEKITEIANNMYSSENAPEKMLESSFIA